MAFGQIMRLKVGELDIELAPLSREVMAEFISPGLQQHSVTRYMLLSTAPVLEDEYEWYEKLRTSTTDIVWGIYDISDDGRKLIGATGIHQISSTPIATGTTGVVIFRSEYWGKGIATAIHKARTWYAFYHKGLVCLNSSVLVGNAASLKALETCGYRATHVNRNIKFVEGELKHEQCVECLNPDTVAWRRWWGKDRPSQAAIKARQRAVQAMEWAFEHVELL